MQRKQNFQSIAWFWDLHRRSLLDLEPPYQRRSVWNQTYRDFYIDTILLGYPSPALFLFENITPDGQLTYAVVDGKQRLSTIFHFLGNQFPVAENAVKSSLRGKYFRDLPDEIKRDIWSYPFTVEYLASDEESIIDNIFERINRNTAKLTAQELRHAKYSGLFITAAERLSEEINEELGEKFPAIAPQQKRQMRDVEFTASLLLLLERGPQGESTSQLDDEFNSRDEEWPESHEVEEKFRATIKKLTELLGTPLGNALKNSRFKNQADFYSLFAVISEMEGHIDWQSASEKLKAFIDTVNDHGTRSNSPLATEYYDAARSASNDTGPRRTRINILRRVLVE